jgi:hypothetical protein
LENLVFELEREKNKGLELGNENEELKDDIKRLRS